MQVVCPDLLFAINAVDQNIGGAGIAAVVQQHAIVMRGKLVGNRQQLLMAASPTGDERNPRAGRTDDLIVNIDSADACIWHDFSFFKIPPNAYGTGVPVLGAKWIFLAPKRCLLFLAEHLMNGFCSKNNSWNNKLNDFLESGAVIALVGAGLGSLPSKSGGRTQKKFNFEEHRMNRRNFVRAIGLSAAITACFASPFAYSQVKIVKVGILHSLSGTMAISETVLKDVALMAIEEINAKGGVMGAKIEPVVVDPASNWPLFAEKARQMLSQDKVAVTFGCWTSVSRKSVLPVFEELNGLLFYPVQYEGEELSKNVFYTGAAPNQQAIPAVEYLMSKDGGSAKRFVLLGTDYVYPSGFSTCFQYCVR